MGVSCILRVIGVVIWVLSEPEVDWIVSQCCVESVPTGTPQAATNFLAGT